MNLHTEERIGSLMAAGGVIWAAYHTTQHFIQLSSLVLPPGPLELSAVGVLIWLHCSRVALPATSACRFRVQTMSISVLPSLSRNVRLPLMVFVSRNCSFIVPFVFGCGSAIASVKDLLVESHLPVDETTLPVD